MSLHQLELGEQDWFSVNDLLAWVSLISSGLPPREDSSLGATADLLCLTCLACLLDTAFLGGVLGRFPEELSGLWWFRVGAALPGGYGLGPVGMALALWACPFTSTSLALWA